MKVLADTSIWSLALRRTPRQLNQAQRALRLHFEKLIADGRIVIIGPIRQEILSGISDKGTFERFRVYLGYFPDEELTTRDYEEAARLANSCRRTEISATATDCLICAFASARNMPIFTTDRDFQWYQQHADIRLL